MDRSRSGAESSWRDARGPSPSGRVSTAVGGNGCDGAAASPDVQPETTNVDGAILGFRNTHSVDDDDPESDLRILRDRHVVRLARRLRCDRFLAAARCKLWWMTPTWGVGGDGLVNASSSTESGVPAETQFAVFELDGGATHVAAVPNHLRRISVHAQRARQRLPQHRRFIFRRRSDDDSSGRGDGDGSCILSLVAESNCEHETCDGVDAALVLTCADSPFKAVEAAMALASKAMNGTFRLRSCKSPPPVVDVFGWCTWDAFYHAVTPAGVEAGAFSFILANRFWHSFGNRRQSYLAIRLTSCFVQLLQGLERWRTADVPRGSSSSTTGGNQWRPTRSLRSALTTSRTTRPPSRISSTSRT
jgi:raffinose synthase